MKELLTALAKAKKKFKPINRNANNPFYKSKYATLDHVVDCIEESLLSEGLVILQPIKVTPEGRMIVSTQLHHSESEKYIESCFMIPETTGKTRVQEDGSSITYARRYTLSALLSLVIDEDDDGNAQSKLPEAQQTYKVEWKEWNKKILNAKTLTELQKLGKDMKADVEFYEQVSVDFLKESYKEKLEKLSMQTKPTKE